MLSTYIGCDHICLKKIVQNDIISETLKYNEKFMETSKQW